MILIIGLGNPEKKYIRTRHNLGFRVVDKFAKEKKFPRFKSSKKFNSLISKDKFDKKKVILAKPQTFMNESGKAAKLLVTRYALPITNLWIIHDDIDLSLGKIRIVKNRGAAGHKGVQSIIDQLETKNFVRFRVGIKPQKTENKEQRTEKFVLGKFTKKEEKILKEVIKRTCQAIEMTVKQGVEKTMNEYNQ